MEMFPMQVEIETASLIVSLELKVKINNYNWRMNVEILGKERKVKEGIKPRTGIWRMSCRVQARKKGRGRKEEKGGHPLKVRITGSGVSWESEEPGMLNNWNDKAADSWQMKTE